MSERFAGYSDGSHVEIIQIPQEEVKKIVEEPKPEPIKTVKKEEKNA